MTIDSHLTRRSVLIRGGVLASTAASGIASPLRAIAQSGPYPSRTITLVVPFAAGGGTDGTARVLASALSTQLGQPVVVDNKPAAGGVLSTAQVARAKPDGYTLLWANTTTMGVSPYLYAKVDYDPRTSFQYISRAATGPLTLVANPSLPFTNIAELVEYAKANPGKLNYGSAGVGTVIHLAAELFKSRAGIEMVHVPYKGNGPALTDIMNGQIQMMFVGVGHVSQFVKSGRLRALAVAASTRQSLMPDVPTFQEAGFRDFEIAEYFGLAAPAGIPKETLQKLSEAFRVAAATDAVRSSYVGYGYTAISESPDEFKAIAVRDGERWKGVIKKLGITAE